MSNPVLFIVHGMGEPSDNWEQDIIATMNDQLPLYDELGDDIAEYVDVVPISYNSEFKDQRERWKDQTDSVSDLLNPALGGAAKLVSYIQGIQARFAEDNFFNTHVLDVLLYRFTLLGHKVRVNIALQIATELKRRAGLGAINTWNIMSHSLGTAAVHDTLHQLFSDNAWLEQETGEGFFTGGFYKANNVIQLANVSRALQTDTIKAYKSRVRPGTGGVCNRMLNCAHHFDPFAQLLRFNPQNDLWPVSAVKNFTDIEIGLVAQKNVHAFEHYLQHPHCHAQIFRRLFGWRLISNSDIDKALKVYKAKTINLDFDSLKQELSELKNEKLSDYSEYFKTLKQYSDIIS